MDLIEIRSDEEMEIDYRNHLHHKMLKQKRNSVQQKKQSSSPSYVPDWYAEKMIEQAIREREA